MDATKIEKLELVFTLCERLGLAAATSVGGAAMLRFSASAFPPFPPVASILGLLVFVGGFGLAFIAAGVFFTKFCGPGTSRFKVGLMATFLVILTVCFVLAVVKAGVVALGH
ncbi:hypothetical protein [Dyella lutea]|uniref:Uncharacterized protein n=1 Tax=Dyella lutea TaxID=2950441 RepID=A0ABT1FD56_9GAMM|nr:hypothetical protein [Dyella lutea]MCP1375307.1 hypothetical protein [Dyella lutea]